MDKEKAPACPYCGFDVCFKKTGAAFSKNVKWSWGCEVCNYWCRNGYRTRELAAQAASVRSPCRGEKARIYKAEGDEDGVVEAGG